MISSLEPPNSCRFNNLIPEPQGVSQSLAAMDMVKQ